MSEPADRRCSVSSVSLIEIKTETHRVLQAFLERTISTPNKDRPGRIAGAYDDHNKHSSSPLSRRKVRADAQTEKEDNKKTGIKDLMKRSIIRGKGSLDRSSKSKQSHPAEDSLSSSSSSDDEEIEKMRKQKQAIKTRVASFFKKKLIKEKKEKEKEQNERQGDLPSGKKAAAANEPIAPETDQSQMFYDEMAQKLEDIYKQANIKMSSPLLELPPGQFYEDMSSILYDDIAQRMQNIIKLSTKTKTPECEKEVLVQQLAKLVSSEGDAMNTKIQHDPELRSKLSRLSFRSFKGILDFFGRSQVTEAPTQQPSTSPTLRRIAISMEVSRRMVTATGTQRMEGFAERYMDNFIPWVKSHGGWGKVLDIDKTEWD